MTAQVLKLNNVKNVAKKPNRSFAKKMKRQAVAAIGIGTVAVGLTALSLSHLATGISIVTNAPYWEGGLMAFGIDAGFIAMELAQLNAATDKVEKAISRFTKPGIVGTMVLSAAMNAFAFASKSQGLLELSVAIVIGVAIPAMIYALTRIGAALYIDCDSRK